MRCTAFGNSGLNSNSKPPLGSRDLSSPKAPISQAWKKPLARLHLKLGTELVEQVRRAGQIANAGSVVVHVHDCNEDAVIFYGALDFSLIEGSESSDATDGPLPGCEMQLRC